ncbi:hypothetical protein [Actinomyces ruminis]|uniref:SurA N-terminal domain-containing protein n=1 Tax=Actinomyces ruminis TaxID=1937003 RepID=A0ABX4MDX0_9ACTO|nr:hypothetical protein [Actinomyces ruminis]PHP53633.1 hypothetical protein BW737_001260 [Actinomyces ruminis]
MTRPTTSLTRRARVLGAGAALLLGVGALAGCSAHPGQAAVVNYTDADGVPQTFTISEQEAQEVAEELSEYSLASGGEEVSSAFVVTALSDMPAVEQLAAEFDIEVSDADALAALQAQRDIDYSPAAVDVFRYVLIANEVYALDNPEAASARYQELVSAMSIKYSPRYQSADAWLLQDDTQVQLG